MRSTPATLRMIDCFRQVARRASDTTAFSRLVDLLEQVVPPRDNLLAVLTYHRVDHVSASPQLYPGMISATPNAFGQQMEYLAKRWRIVSARELLDFRRHGKSLPPRSVMITFDDAYRDFAEHAWPVLRRLGLPVTLFVPTGFPDRPERTFWWDQLYQAVVWSKERASIGTPLGQLSLSRQSDRIDAFRKLKGYLKTLPHDQVSPLVEQFYKDLNAPPPTNSVLGWSELRSLARQGVVMGAHTRMHPLLNCVSVKTAQAEVAGSRRDLERELGVAPPIFAYPSGALNQSVVDVLASEKLVAAFTTARGVNDINRADLLRLKRIHVGIRTNERLIRAQLVTLGAMCRRCYSDQNTKGQETTSLARKDS